MFSSRLINLLKNNPYTGILTGAGMSAESGVPTFRGEKGIWKKLKPELLANFDAFMKNPELVWEWYRHRQELMRDVEPNPGHYALAEMEKQFTELHIITQNVDNLHKRAGSTDPVELHGNILRNRCLDCSNCFDEAEITFENSLPICKKCGGILRPDVVWYGEMLPEEALKRAAEVYENSELFFSIGTSALVQPAASMPLWAKANGAYLVEINIEETPLTVYADEFIYGKSGEVLPDLMDKIQ